MQQRSRRVRPGDSIMRMNGVERLLVLVVLAIIIALSLAVGVYAIQASQFLNTLVPVG